MTDKNQTPANPEPAKVQSATPPSTGGDSVQPTPQAEESLQASMKPVENTVLSEHEAEVVAQPAVEETSTVETAEIPQSETVETEAPKASEPSIKEQQPISTEKIQPETPTPTPVEEVAKVSQPETITAETPTETTATTKEEVIVGAPSKPGDKAETEKVSIEESSPPEPAAVLPKMSEQMGEQKPKTGFQKDGITPLDAEEKLFSAIGYISFLALLPLLARRDSEFAQHHGRQSLVIFIIIFALTLLLSFSDTMHTLAAISTLVVAIGGGMLAYKGDWFKVPGIYDLSLRLKKETEKKSEEAPRQQ